MAAAQATSMVSSIPTTATTNAADTAAAVQAAATTVSLFGYAVNITSVVIVLLFIWLVWMGYKIQKQQRLDFADLLTKDGRTVSLTKLLQLVGGATATWVIIKMTLTSTISESILGIYLAYVGAIEGYSKFVAAKYGYQETSIKDAVPPDGKARVAVTQTTTTTSATVDQKAVAKTLDKVAANVVPTVVPAPGDRRRTDRTIPPPTPPARSPAPVQDEPTAGQQVGVTDNGTPIVQAPVVVVDGPPSEAETASTQPVPTPSDSTTKSSAAAATSSVAPQTPVRLDPTDIAAMEDDDDELYSLKPPKD